MKISSKRKITLVFLVAFLVSVNSGIFICAADDVSDAQKSLKKTQAQLDQELKDLEQGQANLNVTQGQINTTASLLNKTKAEISRKEAELKNLENRAKLNRKILIAYTQEMYYSDQEADWVLVFDSKNFSKFFQNFDQILGVKEKIINLVSEIKKDKENIENVKVELAEKKEEHEDILAGKQVEKNAIVSDINETKLSIAQLQAKMAKLRSVLSSFLGRSFSIDDVVAAVKVAENKTNVRKEFLFAVLDKETDLGRFTGGCTYKNSKMGSANEKIFKSVCNELGYDYNKMKVSCPLSYGIGGAMGVAQFMPTTWSGYKSKIASATGNSPADPWNLKDGIMGMALYLKNKGGDSKGGERTAAAAYYCGSRLDRAVCQNYAKTVISWSKSYDDYF